ncbi:MAG: hypothetical protein OXB96_01900 [Candidatus Kaiserbacteria bacterium]|nr:hypothetical protein [Candidatus Kaiserbacteria bacterium]
MIHRLIFITSVLLLSFPFVGVPGEWKVWVAFGIGTLFFIYSIYSATQHISEKEVESNTETSTEKK